MTFTLEDVLASMNEDARAAPATKPAQPKPAERPAPPKAATEERTQVPIRNTATTRATEKRPAGVVPLETRALPPQNSSLEQALLGAVLFDNALLEQACAGLEPDHFFEPIHRDLFDLISGMIRHGRRADPRTLNATLSEKVIAPNGLTAAQYIVRLVSEAVAVRSQDVQQYAHELVALAWKRDAKSQLEDVQDLLAKGEAVDVLTALREATTAIEGAAPASTSTRFKLIKIDEIQTSVTRDYAIKGLIPRKGLVIVWGPPKCGKSFWVFTLMMHVAMGREYRGHRVHQNEVVYLALEGQDGFGDRRDAFYKHDLKPGEMAPLFNFLGTTLDLVKDHRQLIADIKTQSTKPGCVVIDTLNRSLNGSESNDEDMSAYLRAADAIQHAFNCVVIIIHHCGVNQERPRGHTSQTGAADVQISVKKDEAGIIISTVELAKDMVEGVTFASKLQVVELGTDQDGDPITSCVVVPVENGVEIKSPARDKKPPKGVPTALRALKEAIDEVGSIPAASNHIPAKTKTVTEEQWRKHAYLRGISDGGDRAKQKAFKDVFQWLSDQQKIGIWNDRIWMVR